VGTDRGKPLKCKARFGFVLRTGRILAHMRPQRADVLAEPFGSADVETDGEATSCKLKFALPTQGWWFDLLELWSNCAAALYVLSPSCYIAAAARVIRSSRPHHPPCPCAVE
jgi:hypothetical protein